MNYAVAGTLWLATTGLFAQTEAKDTVRLQGVEITAFYSKPSQVGMLPVDASKAPVSVSAVTNEQIQDHAFYSLNELTRNMTGIRPNNTYGSFMKWTMRGHDNFVLMNDGMRDERHNLYDSAPNTSLAGVERVEYLKGANSVTAGSAALGGVLNIVHKQPTAERRANAKLNIGSWGRYGIEAGAGGEIVKGINFRADFGMTGGDGWRHTKDNAYNLNFLVDFHLGSKDLLQFSWMGKNDYYGTDTGQPIAQWDVFGADGKLVAAQNTVPSHIDRRTRYADPTDGAKDKDMQVALKWTHDFNDRWTLSDRFSYYYDQLSYSATEGLTYNVSSDPSFASTYYMKGNEKVYIDLDHIKRAGYTFEYNVNMLTNTADIKGKFNTGSVKHHFQGGYTYSWMYTPRYTCNYNKYADGPGKNSVVDAVNPQLNQGALIFPYHNRNFAWEQTHSIYAQDYLNITDKFSGVASLRYDFYHRDFQTGATDTSDGVGKTVVKRSDKSTVNRGAFSYRVGLVYQFNDNINAYATTGNYFNFRPVRTVSADGTIYLDRNGKAVEPSNGYVYAPERGFQYEIGSHMNWGSKFNANVALYWITKSNMIQSLGNTEIGGKNYAVSGQVGRADSKGVEVDFQYKPIKQLMFEGGYTYCNAKVKDNSVPASEYVQNSASGKFLTHVPEHSGYGWAYYTFDRCLKGLRLGVGFNASSRVYTTANNATSFAPYAVAHAMVAYRFKNYNLQLNMGNIFDKTYYMTAVKNVNFIPEEGRNFRFSFSVDF